MSAAAAPAPPAAQRARATAPGRPAAAAPRTAARLLGDALPTVLVAGALCLVTFLAGGGLNLDTLAPVEMALTLGCGVAIAAALLLAPAGRPAYGAWPVGLLLALAALSAVSVVWSVQPDGSWQDAGRLFAYSAVFALAALLARVAPARWPAVLGGVVLAATVVCTYALLTKVFPVAVGTAQSYGHVYARLREPYGYWNAIGVAAALGAVGCLWLGARRAGHALWNALAYPAEGLMLVTLLLAYSRGALAALLCGVALWLCVVPLRLRGVAVLGAGALGAAVVVAWDFSQHALTTDNVPLAARVTAGHQLGVLLAAVLVALTLVGLAVGFLTGEHPLPARARRRAGATLLALPALAVLVLAGGLAASHRGLYGSVAHTVSTLTNPNAPPPTNGPGRLTAVGSVRARYWNEALEIFRDHPLLGVGAEGYETARLRYRTAILDVGQAHGFVVQTLADLGLAGLLVVLALLGTWLAAAGRATHPGNRRWTSWRELRAGALAETGTDKGDTRFAEAGRRSPLASIPVSASATGSRLPASVGWRALRPADPARRYSAERVGLLSMVCVVATFGVHSFVDWTWYVPGVACAALLCAGWVAGRGPLSATTEPGSPTRWRSLTLRDVNPLRGALAAAVVLAALLTAWAQWQPLRASDAAGEALTLVARDPAAALAAAHTAVSRDPLSAEALLALAAVQEGAGEPAAAAATYERAVHLQPANFKTWQALGEYELRAGRPQAALQALRAAVYLNPEAVAPRAEIATNGELLSIQNAYLRALRETGTGGGTAAR